MRKESEEKIYDVRLIEKNIHKGVISPKELDKYLQALDDSSDNAEELKLDEEETQSEGADSEADQSENKEGDISL